MDRFHAYADFVSATGERENIESVDARELPCGSVRTLGIFVSCVYPLLQSALHCSLVLLVSYLLEAIRLQ